jgi:hypothetical protein
MNALFSLLISLAFASVTHPGSEQQLIQDIRGQIGNDQLIAVQILKAELTEDRADFVYVISKYEKGSPASIQKLTSRASYRLQNGAWKLLEAHPLNQDVQFAEDSVVAVPLDPRLPAAQK